MAAAEDCAHERTFLRSRSAIDPALNSAPSTLRATCLGTLLWGCTACSNVQQLGNTALPVRRTSQRGERLSCFALCRLMPQSNSRPFHCFIQVTACTHAGQLSLCPSSQSRAVGSEGDPHICSHTHRPRLAWLWACVLHSRACLLNTLHMPAVMQQCSEVTSTPAKLFAEAA